MTYGRCLVKQRKAMLAQRAQKAGFRSPTASSVKGGRFTGPQAVVDADLEGIVAKRLTKWYKVPNRGYSRRRGRAEWFLERGGRRRR